MTLSFVKISWKHAVGIVYLSVQLISIFNARVSENRYFCWAPHDIQTEYYLNIYTSSGELSSLRIKEIYGIPQKGRIDLPPSHIFNLVQTKHYVDNDSLLKVVFNFKVNGKEWEVWKKNSWSNENL